MYVCMYVFMYVCIRTCVCIYACMYACMHACMYFSSQWIAHVMGRKATVSMHAREAAKELLELYVTRIMRLK